MHTPTNVSSSEVNRVKRSALPSILATIAATIYLAIFLEVEAQWAVLSLLSIGIATVLLASSLGWIQAARLSYRANEGAMDFCAIVSVVALTAFFFDDHFVLLLLATVLIYATACLGLNVQFGYAGMLNFAGAALLGVGGYSAAVLGAFESIPTFVILFLGGVITTLIGCLLLPPMLRTYGHYSAVITIAFGLLFTTFLDVNGSLGGPQGLNVRSPSLFGWHLNENYQIGDVTIAFYVNYVAVALALLVVVALLMRRLERSWIGLALDAVRIDETASRCFGISIGFWKSVAFSIGNFVIGLVGALYALMLGYISPSNFTFGDSLILVTVILLGGLGSIWGVILTTAIVIILPEKLQAIQEYRLLLYAFVVALAILFRPDGLIPRAPRKYFTS